MTSPARYDALQSPPRTPLNNWTNQDGEIPVSTPSSIAPDEYRHPLLDLRPRVLFPNDPNSQEAPPINQDSADSADIDEQPPSSPEWQASPPPSPPTNQSLTPPIHEYLADQTAYILHTTMIANSALDLEIWAELLRNHRHALDQASILMQSDPLQNINEQADELIHDIETRQNFLTSSNYSPSSKQSQ